MCLRFVLGRAGLWFSSLAVALTLHGASAQSSPPADGPAWSEVRAVLENRCLRCHGGEKVESEFRLATAETFAIGGARGSVLHRDDLSQSRFLSVVSYRDPDLAMPPDGKLPDAEIELLRAWVAAGASWPADDDGGRLADPRAFPHESRGRDELANASQWWAYRPLHAPTVPVVEDAAWQAHPIDAFVAAELARREFESNVAAAPEVLLRRVTFALTGLPPSPDARATFAADVAARGIDVAFAARVDELLDAPEHGEHLARHWLDLVRYAETNGYERDATKANMWRYRDYVVRAFIEDKPYDRFVLEQLAGDELASLAPELGYAHNDASPRIATGYYRLPVWDDEPADPIQAQAEELADIVDTTGLTFLATSVGCARCHDHKIDPISQRDYFGMTAWFNNVAGFGGGKFAQSLGAGLTETLADVVTDGQLQAHERQRRIDAIDRELTSFGDRLAAAIALASPTVATTPAQTLVADARTGRAASWRYVTAAGRAGWADPAFDDHEWQVGIAGFGKVGTPGAIVSTPWDTDHLRMRTRFALTELPTSLILTVHHDDDIVVHLNGQVIYEQKGYRTDYVEVQLPRRALDSLVVGSNVLAAWCRQHSGGQYVDVGLRTGWLDDAGARRVRLATEAEQWLPEADARAARAALAERERLETLPIAQGYPAQVVREFGDIAPEQRVLLRGSAHAPGDVVEPTVPAVFALDEAANRLPRLPDVPAGAASSGRRLAFARWLVEGGGRDMVARVMANRLWQFVFGRGICRTPSDFGRLGDDPTHRELLDHLATEFIARDWSVRSMLRYMLTSRAYRLASTGGDPRARELDPRNDSYWRFDPRRLTAEQFRDTVLAVAGQLRLELYGPSVYVPLPAAVLATSSRPGAAWGHSPPDVANRRSLYAFVKRSLRVPLLEAFDQPDPDLPCADRFPTNVPTQALMTLNGEFVHDAADRFVERLLGEDPARDVRAHLHRAISVALGREPVGDGELDHYEALVTSLRETHGLDARDALAIACVALFNLNEFLWID